MKRIVRYGVFETNSSSSHSITIKKKDANTSWRKKEDIPGDEKEIRSPVEKMFMVWGLVVEEFFTLLVREKNEAMEIEDEEERSGILEQIDKRYQKLVANRESFISECKKVQEIKEDAVREFMERAEEEPFNHDLCCRFFNEDCLDECTCGYDLYRVYKELGLDYYKDDIATLAKALFDENVYFVTCEEWFGGCWDIDKYIF